jgi:subtilisin family serine protease
MRVLTAAVVAALALPGVAHGARFAVGISAGTSSAVVARALEAHTGGRASVIGPFAVELRTDRTPRLRGLRGIDWVERLQARRRVAFVPTDPFYATRQWYIPAVRGFDAWPLRQPSWLTPTKVAIVDSGIDGDHPEFRFGRIAAANTFVGGSALKDVQGHGTFVAGLIAARLDGFGMAGLAFPAQLLVAKVVRPDGTVPIDAEARAIRWAVDHGAKVINLSLGGLRNPLDPMSDGYSPLEASAVRYAVRKGAVVVAAVGNADQAPDQPWRYASYPAALPHVRGVSAVARDGTVPMFSNRDAVFNDIAAPGDELFSTLPRWLTAERPGCIEQGYSDCGPTEFRRAQGTSFATAIVSAGVALARSTWPELNPEQITTMLERKAIDQSPATGCRKCSEGRDALTGWGRLDIASVVDWTKAHPVPDRYETNDEGGSGARLVRRRRATIRARIDYWDDQNDVYAVPMKRNQRLRLMLFGEVRSEVDLAIWRPGTRRVDDVRSLSGTPLDRSTRPGARDTLRFRAPRAGRYYVQVKMTQPGSAPYRLDLRRQ